MPPYHLTKALNISKETWNYTNHTKYLIYTHKTKYSSSVASNVFVRVRYNISNKICMCCVLLCCIVFCWGCILVVRLCVFLHDRPWISPWIKSISNELDITIHMIWSYFGVYFPRCFATREINTKITLSWVLNQFVSGVHTLFSINSPMFPRLIWLALGQLHHCPHTSEVSLKNGSETDCLILGMHWLFSKKSSSIETIMFRTVITH